MGPNLLNNNIFKTGVNNYIDPCSGRVYTCFMSINAGVGISSEADLIIAAREATGQARVNLGGKKIDLAVCFSTINFAFPSLLKTISVFLNDCPIIGCSTQALITNSGIIQEGVTVMLLSFSEDTFFNTACVREIKSKGSMSAGEEMSEKLLYGFKGVRRDVGIIFYDGLMEDSTHLLYGLQEKLGKSFPIVGGCASDNLAFKNTYIYYNREVLSDAACGILLGGKINFGIGAKHGWKPLGKPRRVTSSFANAVFEIDNKPAAEVYKEYLAADIEELKKGLKRISILYPIGIHIPGEEEYLLRNLLVIRKDGALIFQGAVPQGSEIRLMIGTKESCLSAASQALSDAKKENAGKEFDFAMVFDSVSRHMLLGRQAKKELDIIRGGLAMDTPVAGIYTYGEHAPSRSLNYQGVSRLHNQTITILGIGG